ncbi:MAG: hypothetical protein ABWY95_06330 [Thermoleophilaceae bacterium]
MEGASRTRLVALAALLALSIPLVIVAVAGSGGDGDSEQPAALRVERTPGAVPEIIVYLEDRSLNEPSTAGGAATVIVECVDDGGEVVSSKPESWPFTDTDQGTLDPHADFAVSSELLDRIARCRLKGTDPPLEGRLL